MSENWKELTDPEQSEKPAPVPASPKTEVSDDTGIISTSQIAEMSRNPESSRNSVAEIKANINKSYSKPSSSPDISDIMSKSEMTDAKEMLLKCLLTTS